MLDLESASVDELADLDAAAPGLRVGVGVARSSGRSPSAVRWPGTRRKQDFIKLAADERRLLVPNRNYVLMRRFSAKEDAQRITAAPYLSDRFDCGLLGLENHLNYIHRPGGSLTRHEALGLAALYNSKLLDTYFRAINGNTQVSATELRAMPLPAREVIEELGRRVAALDGGFEGLDSLVADVLRRSAGDSETDTDGDDPGGAADLESARLAESPAE